MPEAREEFKAPRLKVMALHWLRSKWPGAVLTTELALHKWGEASVDVAAILPSAIIGVEVKGDGDSHRRLERQGWVYSRSATELWLLPAPALHDKMVEHKPRGWGVLRVEDGGLVEQQRCWRDEIYNSPAALLDICWRRELDILGRKYGFKVKGMTAVQLQAALAEIVTLAEARAFTCGCLRSRQWDGRVPYPKVVYHPGDPLPEPNQSQGDAR